MSIVPNPGNGKITVPDLLQRKDQAPGLHSKSEKITCLTAYDYPTARLLDEAGVDVILVGDSVGMVALGYESTRSEEHTSELQSRLHLVCRLLLEKKKKLTTHSPHI